MGERFNFFVQEIPYLYGLKGVFQWTPAPPSHCLKAAKDDHLAAFLIPVGSKTQSASPT